MTTVFTLNIERVSQNCFWDWEVIDKWPLYTTVYPHPLCLQPTESYRLLTKFEDITLLQTACLKNARCVSMYVPSAIDSIFTDVGDFFNDSLYDRQQNCIGIRQDDIRYLSYQARFFDDTFDMSVRMPPLKSPTLTVPLACSICSTLEAEYCAEILELDGQMYDNIPFGDEFHDCEGSKFEFILDEDWEFVNKNLPLNIYMEEVYLVRTPSK